MYAYAQLCGLDVSEFYGEEIAPRLMSFFGRVADRLMAGQPMGRAMEKEAKRDLDPEMRARLDLLSPQFRALLQEQAGRDWDALSDEQKSSILSEVARLARGGEQGSRGGVVPPLQKTDAKAGSGPRNSLQ